MSPDLEIEVKTKIIGTPDLEATRVFNTEKLRDPHKHARLVELTEVLGELCTSQDFDKLAALTREHQKLRKTQISPALNTPPDEVILNATGMYSDHEVVVGETGTPGNTQRYHVADVLDTNPQHPQLLVFQNAVDIRSGAYNTSSRAAGVSVSEPPIDSTATKFVHPDKVDQLTLRRLPPNSLIHEDLLITLEPNGNRVWFVNKST